MIKKLLPNDSLRCFSLIQLNKHDFNYFKNLGWSLNQFSIQLSKNNNFTLGLFSSNVLKAIIIGDLIVVEKILEYEILLLYVNVRDRKIGYASKLLNRTTTILKKKKLKKIYLEVASNNKSALNLYKKNYFMQTGLRKNYYQIENKKIDAILLEKKIDNYNGI